jgi:hypothetical protein
VLDAVILEKAGIPTVPLLTDAFESTAKEMAELWGVPDFRFVMMPHPLGSLSANAITKRANELISPVLALLRDGQPE